METNGTSAIVPAEQQPANILSIPRSFFLMTEEQFKRIQFMAKMYAASSFNAGDDKKTEGDYFILMIKGVELGMSLTAAVEFISVIKGKPCIDGKGMLALIRNSPKCKSITIDSQADYCSVTGTRADSGDTHTEIFTIEDAQKFKVYEKGSWIPLADRHQWKSQPKTMLKWRAVAAFGRAFFSDVIGGLYSKEEMLEGDAAVSDSGEMTAITTPKKWFEEERALHELSERSFTAGIIKERNGKGVIELEALIAPNTWADYADRASAATAIKRADEARKAQQAAPAVAIPTTADVLAIVGNAEEPPPPEYTDDYLPVQRGNPLADAGGIITTNKVEYNGKDVCVRLPNNRVVPCGDKTAFIEWLDKSEVGFAAMNDVPNWKADAKNPKKEYTLSSDIHVRYEMAGSAYSLVSIEVVAEPVPMGGVLIS